MPLKWFLCPDNERIEIKDCLMESGCRVGDRCATRSYLRLVSNEREWTGKPSTTQLINGTMNAFLKLTKDYAVSPASRAFMIHGTKGHGNLEIDDEYSFLEEKFNSDEDNETGIADVFEIESGQHTLVDYKTSGSYKVAKALGFYVDKEETGEVYKSGKRKGEMKTRNVLKRDDSKIERWEWDFQLNNYRMKFEAAGFPVDQMKVMCIVRDGNTHIARNRGVFRNIYYFKIKKIPDQIIRDYFTTKKMCLIMALEQDYWLEPCSATENWNGLKCQSYCEVAEYCNYGKFLMKEKESEDMAIKGLSEIRRLPRLGKIRLGIKKKSPKTGAEYPAEVDYFILDPQTPNEMDNEALIEDFKNLYGDQPKRISIMFPVANPDVYFAQFYKRYGSSSLLKCKGDGETASCSMTDYTKGLELLGPNEMGMPQVKCEGRECIYYKKRECSEVGTLQILLPEMKGAGVWQITTGSFHSIVNINSCIEYIKTICGRAHMIPLTLERRKQETQFEGKKANHYILHINMDLKLADIQKYAMIEPSKILLELPSPDSDREDILFQENTEIESQTEEAVPFVDTVEESLNTIESAAEIMQEVADMIDEEPTEVVHRPVPVTIDDRLKNAKDLNELKKIWEEVVKIKNSGLYSKDEVMDLVAIKEQRKRDLMSKK